MFASEEGFGGGEGVIRGNGGELGFIGCLVAWGITECIRYGFFALQVSGSGIPGWLTWLRFVEPPFLDGVEADGWAIGTIPSLFSIRRGY